MALDATLQVRMDGRVKNDVEQLYRELGTSFAEAVRIFAVQSLLSGGMPFCPTLKRWEDMTEADIERKLASAEADIQEGRVYSQAALDSMMQETFGHGN